MVGKHKYCTGSYKYSLGNLQYSIDKYKTPFGNLNNPSGHQKKCCSPTRWSPLKSIQLIIFLISSSFCGFDLEILIADSIRFLATSIPDFESEYNSASTTPLLIVSPIL